MIFSSLSKRSNVPGLRSGFVAGDAALLKKFLLYRTYHGGAMNPAVQSASIAAWNDEAHVRENRAAYVRKFSEVTPMLAEVLDVALPDAGFYLWADVSRTGLSDTEFAARLLAGQNVTVLPGSYLRAKPTASTPAPTACAWPWWPHPRNAWKVRAGSLNSAARSAERQPMTAARPDRCAFIR